MSNSLLAVLTLLILSLALATPASAYLITVNFTLAGSEFGSFSFDGSIIPTGGGDVGAPNGNTDYAQSISLILAGQSWTVANAGVNFLSFDTLGNLTSWKLGGDLNGIGAIDGPAGPDFYVSTLLSDNSDGVATVNPDGSATGISGLYASDVVAFTVQHEQASESGPLSLTVAGLLGLSLVRRRSRSPQPCPR